MKKVKNTINASVLLVSSVFFIPSTSFGQNPETDFGAKIVRQEGEIEIFYHKTLDQLPQVKYDGQVYSYKQAGLGDKINSGDIIRSKTGKARIIFNNGDQIHLNEGSSLSYQGSPSKEQPESTLNLIYGKIRSIISSDGPRKNLKIKANSTSFGIRGTDFSISSSPTESNANVQVLRGKAELKNLTVVGGEKILVDEKTQKPSVARVSKEDLLKIQKLSTVKKSESSEEGLQNSLNSLEKKSFENTLSDIKKNDPSHYQQIKDLANLDDVDTLNTLTIQKVYKNAPSDSNKKLTESEIDALGKDIYEQYFRP